MTDSNDFNPNVYWIANGTKYAHGIYRNITATKYHRHADALIAAEPFNSEIEFYFHRDAFGRFDWTIEPAQSFDELCAVRAQQLRDNYKYLRLWYSGGADSHTVLRTFIDNNIHLDEIVTIRVGVIDKFDTSANREINQTAMPYLDSIRLDIPKTKISTIDISASTYLEYYKSDDWFLQCRDYGFADDASVIINSHESIERYGGLTIPSGCAEITGGDKPKVLRHDGVYYIPMVDSRLPYLHIANLEEFYITPDLPELHSKQCHVLKHIVEQMFSNEQDLTYKIYDPVNGDPYFRALWNNCCRQIINPELDYGKGWKIITPKGRARLADAQNKSVETIKYYSGSLLEFQQSVKNHWGDLDAPPPGNISALYSIGKYNE